MAAPATAVRRTATPGRCWTRCRSAVSTSTSSSLSSSRGRTSRTPGPADPPPFPLRPSCTPRADTRNVRGARPAHTATDSAPCVVATPFSVVVESGRPAAQAGTTCPKVLHRPNASMTRKAPTRASTTGEPPTGSDPGHRGRHVPRRAAAPTSWPRKAAIGTASSRGHGSGSAARASRGQLARRSASGGRSRPARRPHGSVTIAAPLSSRARTAGPARAARLPGDDGRCRTPPPDAVTAGGRRPPAARWRSPTSTSPHT